MKKLFYTSLILFLVISVFVITKDSLVIDKFIYDLINPVINESLTKYIVVLTDIGSLVFSTIVILIVSVLLLKYKKKKDLKYFLIILAVGNILSYVFKLLFARERPDILVLAIENTYSYPSGHTFITTLLYGMILVLISKYYKKNYAFICLYAVLVLFVMFTRIYLGVHYFSDTLGGLLLGIVFLTMFYELVGDVDGKEMAKRREISK